MSNFTTENLIEVPASSVPAGTLAMKVGQNIFTAGRVIIQLSSSGTQDLDAYVVQSNSGVLYARKLKFNGTQASDSQTVELLSDSSVLIFKTGHPEPAPEPTPSPGTSMDFYKCTYVSSDSSMTWTGYKAVLSDSVYSFESTVTSGLTWSVIKPEVGKAYSTNARIKAVLFTGTPLDGLVLYAPLSSSALTADTGQAITTASGVTFTTEDSIPCARLIDSAVNFEIAPTDVPIGSNPRTICIWIKRDSQYTGTEANIIQYGTAGQNNQVAIGYSGGKICVDLYFNQNLGSVTVDQTQWNFIAMTMANSTVKVYLNGVLHMTFNSSFNTGSSQYVNIGQNGSGEWPFGSGYAAGLRIYDRELSADEIAMLAGEFTPTA